MEAPVLDRPEIFAGLEKGKEKRLITVITGEPAPRPDGKNLFVRIVIDPETATFHCQEEEHMGNHEGRFVTFQANATCTLHFTNPDVFDMNKVDLTKNQPKPLHNKKRLKETGYYVTVNKAQMEIMLLGEPKIVVP